MKAHHVLNERAPVGCDRLAVVTFRYVDFSGIEHDDGKIVVMDALAERVSRIFDELHARRFPIAKAQLLQTYEGDDEASMADNNTSGFNGRTVTGGGQASLHAYGAAIDINPVQNPFVTRAEATFTVHPVAGAAYVNRMLHRPGKPDRAGMAEEIAAVFAENGFVVWGGTWDDPLDFQHFDIGRPLAARLAALAPDQAQAAFEAFVAVSTPK